MMVAISAGIQVNWVQVLFSILTNLVSQTTLKHKDFAVQICRLLEQSSVALGLSSKLHMFKILNKRSIEIYKTKKSSSSDEGSRVTSGRSDNEPQWDVAPKSLKVSTPKKVYVKRKLIFTEDADETNEEEDNQPLKKVFSPAHKKTRTIRLRKPGRAFYRPPSIPGIPLSQ